MTDTRQSSLPLAMMRRIRRHGRSWAFTPKDFLDLGSRAAVDAALSRLCRKGEIRRIERGLYDYPLFSETLKRPLSPLPHALARALARSRGTELLNTDAHEANALGFSEHVPARLIFLADFDKIVKIGRGEILFRKMTSRDRRLLEFREVAPILQALRFLGKELLAKKTAELDSLRDRLDEKQRTKLLRSKRAVPTWMHPYLDCLASDEIAQPAGHA